MALASSLAVGAGVLAAPAAHAAGLSCGDTITANTTLTANLGPCPNNGLVIGADNIVLNLNGHTISGTPAPGDGAGVLIPGHTGVKVTNGTVTAFDGGVVIQNGGGNTVTRIVAKGNVGASPGTLYGDGIAIEGSSGNQITQNSALRNGPFSGIGIYQNSDSDHPFTSAPAVDNLVKNNTVQNNVACREGNFCDNDGIRIEPGVSPGNKIYTNKVTGNGLDGISLFGGVNGTNVSGNTVRNNGFNGAVPGDGIRVFGFNNTIASNIVNGNAQDGISVGRRSISPPGSLAPPNGRDNTIKFNTATRNGVHDLYDSNIDPPCDNNRWTNNSFVVAVPASCIS
ncbi:MAG TPA: right-handed parallel beta-helix repeat-containing protein [Acidimicrobiales bacterium]|nr:right-handed parallel beta-helix repeat-containing protein [Acidimicrobiales bacterium]